MLPDFSFVLFSLFSRPRAGLATRAREYTCAVLRTTNSGVRLLFQNRFIYVGVDISMYALLTGGRS